MSIPEDYFMWDEPQYDGYGLLIEDDSDEEGVYDVDSLYDAE